MSAAASAHREVLRRRLSASDLVLGALVAIVVGAALVAALAPHALGVDARAVRLESELRCPVCQGVSIADSPAQSAQEMRALVRQQVAQGDSDGQVLAFFVARYGQWILLTPSSSGLELGLWLAPGAIVVGGALLLVALRTRRASVPAPLTEGHPTGVPEALAAGIGDAPRWVRLGLAGLLVTAVAGPLLVAVGPRLPGEQITGQPPPSLPAVSIAALEAAARARPADEPTLAALGDAYLEAGRASDAIGAFERALAINPRDAPVLAALGSADLEAGRATDAVSAFERALTIDPQNVPSLLGLGVILLGADRASDAGPLFDRVLVLAPDQPDALLYRALARTETDGGLTAAARADLERFLAVAPGDPRRTMAEQLLAGPAASPRP